MSNPDLTSEMAYFLQDNTVQFLKGATEDELTEFVNTLLPHVSPVGVNRIYPVVSEPFPARSKVGYELQATAREPDPPTMEDLADDDEEVRRNYLRGNPEKEGTNGD